MAELAGKMRTIHTRLQNFNLVKGTMALEAEFDDGVKFGILDKRNSETLDPILDHPQIQLNGQAETNTIESVIDIASKAADAVMRIDIHIYGPMSLSERVGTSLSVRKTWLQRPNTPKFPYRNPQTIVFPNMDVENPQHPAPRFEAKDSSPPDFHKSLAKIYSTLRRDKDLSRVQGDIGLRTHLLE